MNTLADTIAAMKKEQKITGERKMSESLIPHEVVAKMSYAQQELAVVCMEPDLCAPAACGMTAEA